MSLLIIKAGLLDTIQDGGRKGFRHLGINPSGAMDTYSAQLANALLGKDLNDPVIEMHFPAPHLMFKRSTIICITGADFQPVLDNEYLPLAHPVMVPKGAILRFEKMISGARCYLSVWHGWKLAKWMDSFSTNLKAGMGGWKGRALITGDEMQFLCEAAMPLLDNLRQPRILPWTTAVRLKQQASFAFIPGNEWCCLTSHAKEALLSQPFTITQESDRMGYRLSGTALQLREQPSLVSSAVSFGTMQLLPNGQLVVLMADHQTAGGYPRVGHIIAPHLPLLAQKQTHEEIFFSMAEMECAQKEQAELHRNLRLLEYACKIKLEDLLHDYL